MNINTGMILAAGYVKRLRPITKKIPKPLLKVNNKLLIEYAIEILLKVGIKRIYINTHYKDKLIKNFIKKKYNNKNITLVHEPILLDTGGAVKNVIKMFKIKSLIILNSDIYWNKSTYKDLKKLINIHLKNKYNCTLLLSRLNNSYGIKIKKGDFIKSKNILIRNIEKNKGLIYTGAQVIDAEIFNVFRQKIFSFNLIWDYLINKKKLHSTIMQAKWFHLGDFKLLKKMNKFNLE